MRIFAPDRTIPTNRIIIPEHIEDYQDKEALINLAVHSKQLKIKTTPDKPLLLFTGGARDFFHNAVLNQLYLHYAARNSHNYHIAYATHAANDGIVALIQKWHKANQRIYLVGHSWGGSRLMKVIHKEAKNIPIECLITLDPVSRLTRGRDYKHPKNVKLWANSYIDYNNVGLNIPNIVAIIGGHWLACPAADYNFAVSHYQQQEVNHMNAWALFKKTKRFIPDFH